MKDNIKFNQDIILLKEEKEKLNEEFLLKFELEKKRMIW